MICKEIINFVVTKMSYRVLTLPDCLIIYSKPNNHHIYVTHVI